MRLGLVAAYSLWEITRRASLQQL